MNKFQAKLKFKEYLNSHFIGYHEDSDNDTDRLTMVYKGYDNVPNKIIESCIFFFSDYMEVRVYYSETGREWCEKSHCLSEFMRLLNYINATVWARGLDGVGGMIYETSYLYTTRLYMTEDGCHDITMTSIVPYDFYEIAPLETEDYFTACLPELMDLLSPAIFLLLLGQVPLEYAMQIVDESTKEREETVKLDIPEKKIIRLESIL